MITLAVIWITWCFLHSFLIRHVAMEAAKRVLGSLFPLYRLLYVGFSVFSLVPVLWYQFLLPQTVIVPRSALLLVIQAMLLIYAVFMFYAGARVYDMGYVLGLTQWRSYHTQTKVGELPFRSDGVLAYVRHPWYSGGIAFLWGIGQVTDVYLLTRIILTVYIVAGTLLEEARLRKVMGEQYQAYCQKVPMLLPWRNRDNKNRYSLF